MTSLPILVPSLRRLALALALVASVLVIPAAHAATCTMTTPTPTTNWTDTTKWSGCGGTYPGAGSGDTAIVGFSSFTLNIDAVIPNGVVLNLSAGSINVAIPAGSALQIESSSSSTSSNTININGGQLGVGSGIVSWAGNLVHNTGTLALTGTLANTAFNGTFTINGGNINGPGTLQVVSGSTVPFTGSGGSININGAVIDNFGSIPYSVSSPNTTSLLNGAKIKLETGCSFTMSSNGSIQTNNVGSPAIEILGGAMTKSTSTGTMQIDAAVNNAGSVTVTSGRLNLYGGGTSSGVFSTATGGTTMAFNGSTNAHDIGAGATAVGGGTFELVGGNFNVNTSAATPWAPQFFTQSGGTLAGTGTIRVTNTFNWSGGTQSSAGTTELQGTTNILGNAVTLDTGRIVSNSGTINYGPNAGVLTIDSGAHIDNTGTFDLLNDASIASSSPSLSYIGNSGSALFKKSAGTTSNLNCGFNLNGTSTLQPAASTTIALLGGTSAGGTFGGSPATIDLSGVASKVDLAGGSFNFAAAGVTVSGTGGGMRLSGTAVLQLSSGPLTVTNFVQDGSSLLQSNVSGISIPSGGAYTWNGGTLDALSGAGTDLITVNGGASLKLFGTSAMTMQGSAHIKNAGGTITFNPSANLSINSGAVLDNASGTFAFNNNNSFGITTNNFNNPLFKNNGTVTKAANPNTVQIDVKFDHNTTLAVNGGTLRLMGGGTSAGSMTATNAADRIEINGGNYFLATGATFGGLGTLAVGPGAILTNNAAFNVTNFELDGGTVNGGGSLTINNAFKVFRGTFTGAGSATTSAGVVTNATALTGPITFSDGFTFNNNGTFNYNPTFNLNFENNGGGGATFNNNALATFDVQGNGATAVVGTGNSFANLGTIKKTAGAGGFTFTVRVGNQGSGIIDQQFGSNSTIAFNATGSFMSGGTMQSSDAAGKIAFTGGDFTVTGGAFTGSGLIYLGGATLQINANISAATTLQVDSGVLDVSSPNTFQITTLHWNGGTLQGAGTKRVFGGFITAASPTTLDGSGFLTLPAPAFTYDADAVNYLTINSTAKLNIESGGALDITGNGIIAGAATAKLSSTGGTLKKSGAVTARINVPIDFTSGSGGTINITAGILELAGGGTIGGSAGSVQIAPATELAAVGGTLDVNASATFSGTGTLRINGGTVNFNTPVTLANLQLDSGALGGSANVALDGGKWTGGNMDGTGTTSLNAGKTFELSTGTLKKLRRNFTNNGLLYSQTLPAALTLENAAVLTNNSLTELQTNTNFFCTCTPTPSRFHNAVGGTLRTLNASGTSNFLTVVDNDGTVDVQTGILNFLNGGTHTGDFTVGTGTYLAFDGTSDSFSSTATVSGDGQVGYNANTTSFAGTHNITGNGQTIIEANVTFTSASTINTAALNFRTGTIGGTSSFAITGGPAPNSWQSGTITGNGSFTLAAGKTIHFDGSNGPMTLDGRTFTNNGTIVYDSASNALTLANGGVIFNSGTFNIQSDTAVNIGPGTNTFTNAGTFAKTLGTGTTNFAPVFNNFNLVDLASGTVSFDGGFTQTTGNTTLNGGNLASPLTVAINTGTLNGVGTITGNVSNAGSLNPGLSPGGLTIAGNYTQTSTGIFNAELGGTTPVTGYDQVNVTGTANLSGTLNVTLFGGFTPANNDVFDILTYASDSGTFATVNLPTFPGGGSFTTNQNATRYRLIAQTVQADVGVSQTTSGPALHGQNATFTVTVTNAGPNSATSVTLTDTMSGASLLTATSTIGSCTTGSPIVCTIGTLTSGQSATVTITVNANSVGTITNSASVTANEFDPNNGNNATGTASINVSAAADLSVSIADSPDPVTGGASTTYTVTVNNSGPDNATSAAVALTMTNGTIISTTSAAFNCTGTTTNQTCNAIAPLGPGTTLISVTVQAPPASGTMSLKANASSSTGDPNTANNIDIENTAIGENTDLSIAKSGPASIASGANIVYTIVVTNNGTANATNVVVSDPTPTFAAFVSNSGACTTAFPCSLGTINAGQSKTITATFRASSNRTNEGRTIVNVASVTSNAVDPTSSNNQDSAQTTIACENTAPTQLAPANGITVPANGTLTWSGNGQSYTVFLGPAGNGCSMQFATSTTESLAYSGLTPGATYEWRVVSDRGQCAVKSSACVSFKVENTCTTPETPLARVVGQQTSSKTYSVEWDAVPGATRYEIDEATNAQFTDAVTSVVQGLEKSYKHDVTVATAFHYRVRAFNDCGTEHSANSATVRVVIVPLAPSGQPGNHVNIPAGSTELVVQQVFIPGQPNQSLFYTATTDRPWLTVHPSSGALPPQGVTVNVTADPATLPNGTFTASLIVTVTEGQSGSSVRANGGTSLSIPVSINLVTPVSPVASKDAASQYAMVVPSIGHLDGINSFWQSDVRITNAGFKAYRYKLTFTPTGGTSAGVKQTTITVDAGATTALDDIVRNWYGFGALGDNAQGMLEILPIDDVAAASAATVASSRTYNLTDNGTLGQFIPAVRFPSFIGQAQSGGLASILSIQQVAESAAFRTNLGIAEGSGSPVSVLLSVFNGVGTKLLTAPLQLAAGEQRQLNGFLAQNNIVLTDGRVEVQVAGGSGKVTAYASVIDNNTRDPLLVSGTLLQQSGAAKWVLPGVANLDNPFAHWRTDMRAFNYGASVQTATLTFYPQAGGTPKSVNVDLQPGTVLTLDDVLASKFGIVNAGGVVHLTTGSASSLVVTGRTYNQTSTGTFGQFIPAVTPDEAVGNGGPTLHILQVEDSARYRTNIGLAEVTGAPATVEVQVVLPDSKFTPTVRVPLAANEFRQFNLIRDLALGNVYNGRVTVRVVDGPGRVTAYGSVIDEKTQDPTYVPAQK